jgi:hypothetical protein
VASCIPGPTDSSPLGGRGFTGLPTPDTANPLRSESAGTKADG